MRRLRLICTTGIVYITLHATAATYSSMTLVLSTASATSFRLMTSLSDSALLTGLCVTSPAATGNLHNNYNKHTGWHAIQLGSKHTTAVHQASQNDHYINNTSNQLVNGLLRYLPFLNPCTIAKVFSHDMSSNRVPFLYAYTKVYIWTWLLHHENHYATPHNLPPFLLRRPASKNARTAMKNARTIPHRYSATKSYPAVVTIQLHAH